MRTFLTNTVISFCLSLCWMPSSLAQSQWQVGGWTGAEVLDHDGKFSFCVASASSNGLDFGFSVHKAGDMFLDISGAHLKINKGTVIKVIYSNEDSPLTQMLPWVALRDNSITTKINYNKNFIDGFDKNSILRFNIEGGYSLQLSLEKSVLTRLANCYLKYEPPTK